VSFFKQILSGLNPEHTIAAENDIGLHELPSLGRVFS
jgi:hypothetical protein